MCGAVGKVRAVNTAAPNFTTNAEYPILGLHFNASGGDVWAFVVDDNGDIVTTNGDIAGNQFATVELYAGTKVI